MNDHDPRDDLQPGRPPRGPSEEAAPPTYRAPTAEELEWTHPATPRKFEKRIWIGCPTGVVVDSTIVFEDGEQLTNVVRAVISLESPTVARRSHGQGLSKSDGLAYVFVTQFHNEIGRMVYGTAQALVGEPGCAESDAFYPRESPDDEECVYPNE